jgi:hypothetical protein
VVRAAWAIFGREYRGILATFKGQKRMNTAMVDVAWVQ